MTNGGNRIVLKYILENRKGKFLYFEGIKLGNYHNMLKDRKVEFILKSDKTRKTVMYIVVLITGG